MVRIADGHLPQDLLIDILSRLPVKSILRCKCICKEWYSIIQSPNFIDKHYHNRNNNNRLLVHHHIFKWHYRNHRALYAPVKSMLTYFPNDVFAQHFVHQVADYPISSPYFDLIGPVNGVFLVFFSPEDHASGNLALWNPATRVFKVLPPPKLDYQRPGLQWSGFNLAFGCEPTTNNFKVVWFLFSMCKTKAVAFAVYSVKTNSWRQIHISAPELICSISGIVATEKGFTAICARRVGTYFKGAYYWLSQTSARKNSLEIVLFDMEKEIFRVIPTPPSLDPGMHSFPEKDLKLMLHNDALALLVSRTYCGVVTCIDIWLMEREGFWSQHTVLKPNLEELVTPLAFWGDGISQLICQGNGHKLYLYNPDTTTNHGCELIPIRNFESEAYLFKIFNYKESIVPIISEGCASTTGSFSFIQYIAEKLVKICQNCFG